MYKLSIDLLGNIVLIITLFGFNYSRVTPFRRRAAYNNLIVEIAQEDKNKDEIDFELSVAKSVTWMSAALVISGLPFLLITMYDEMYEYHIYDTYKDFVYFIYCLLFSALAADPIILYYNIFRVKPVRNVVDEGFHNAEAN